MSGFFESDPPPAQPGEPGPPAAPAGPAVPRRALLAGVAAVVAIVLAVLAYLLFFAGSSGAGSPTKAVSRLLDAGRTNDVSAARKVLCKPDQKLGVLDQLQASGRVTSYRITGESTKAGVHVVTAAVVTAGGGQATSDFPVVREGGGWKVCLSVHAPPPGGGLPSASDLPATPSDTGGASGSPTVTTPTSEGATATGSLLPSGLPTDLSLCAYARNGLEAANTYVQAAETGVTVLAKSCVYQGAVPDSITNGLKGKIYAPATTDTNATSILFSSVDGTSRITVTVAKEADGKWWVVGVKTG